MSWLTERIAWAVAGDELELLHALKSDLLLYRRWLGEFPEIAMLLDNIAANYGLSGFDEVTYLDVSSLREKMRARQLGFRQPFLMRAAKTLRDGETERADRAERALIRAGWTYTEGAAEWKPPVGPSASRLLERIDKLQAEYLGERAAYLQERDKCDRLVSALEKYEAAFDDLFGQCASNPITNAWGKEVNLSLLNEAHQAAGSVLREVKGGGHG